MQISEMILNEWWVLFNYEKSVHFLVCCLTPILFKKFALKIAGQVSLTRIEKDFIEVWTMIVDHCKKNEQCVISLWHITKLDRKINYSPTKGEEKFTKPNLSWLLVILLHLHSSIFALLFCSFPFLHWVHWNSISQKSNHQLERL